MKSLICSFLIVFCIVQSALSQTFFTTTGNWDTAGNWLASNIGDDLSEDVTINANRVALINNGFNYTIGNLTFGNNAGITINSTGILNVGDSGNPRNATAGNAAAITVSGTLIIWGNLIVNNSLSLTVSGTLIVKGNIQMANGASISVTGAVQVDGDFLAGDNTNFTISGGGGVDVNGNVVVGIDSNLTGPPGSFRAHGCTQGGGSNFCSGGVLPIDLLFFRATATLSDVRLIWATASELNSDYFMVEKSEDGLLFKTLSKINAQGNSTVKIDYETWDEKPTIGITYYRLKEVDLDGKETIFKVVLVDFTGLRTTAVYPNPIDNEQDLTLELNFVPEHPLEVSVFDLSGKSIERLIMKGSAVAMPIHLSRGMYIVRVSSPEYSSISKFLVRE